MKRKPVPAKLAMDCMKELNVVVAQMIDCQEHFTEAEIAVLCWYSRFHELMKPFLGPIPLSEPKNK